MSGVREPGSRQGALLKIQWCFKNCFFVNEGELPLNVL